MRAALRGKGASREGMDKRVLGAAWRGNRSLHGGKVCCREAEGCRDRKGCKGVLRAAQRGRVLQGRGEMVQATGCRVLSKGQRAGKR